MKAISNNTWKLLLIVVPIALLLAFMIPLVASGQDGVKVVLFNGDEILGDPHKVQISGLGDYTTGDMIPSGDLPASGRLHRGGVYGDWQTMDPANDDGSDNSKLELEFATVHVTLYNDEDDDGIEEGEKLSGVHKVEVSGVGDFTTCDMFHVPPTAKLSYRLHRGGVYGDWHRDTSFQAG